MKFKPNDRFRIIPYSDGYLYTTDSTINMTGVVKSSFAGGNLYVSILPSWYEWYVIQLDGIGESICPHVCMEKIDPDSNCEIWERCLKGPDLVKDERTVQTIIKEKAYI